METQMSNMLAPGSFRAWANEVFPDPEPPILCPECGSYCEGLYEVEDSDASVGYAATVSMCSDCRTRITQKFWQSRSEHCG